MSDFLTHEKKNGGKNLQIREAVETDLNEIHSTIMEGVNV